MKQDREESRARRNTLEKQMEEMREKYRQQLRNQEPGSSDYQQRDSCDET